MVGEANRGGRYDEMEVREKNVSYRNSMKSETLEEPGFFFTPSHLSRSPRPHADFLPRR